MAGGLAPRYIVGQMAEGARAHVGTTDVDLVIGLAVEDDPPDTYYTLATNLERAGFRQVEPIFRRIREVEGVLVAVELLGEAEGEMPGRSFRPRGQRIGSGLALLNIPGAHLVTGDYFEQEIEAERLDGTGRSRVTVRVAGVLSYTVLKIQAFQDRHENKDAYDLVFTLVKNYPGGASEAGVVAAHSQIAGDPQTERALGPLEERFSDAAQDAAAAYAGFLADPDDPGASARRRREAVVAVRAFLRAYRLAKVRLHSVQDRRARRM